MRTAVCNVATAPGSTVVSALTLRALVVVVVVGCLLSGCLPAVDGRPVTDVERTELTAEVDGAISDALVLRQRRGVDAVSTAGDQLQQQQLSSRMHAAIVDVVRERRRLRRDAADKSTVTPPNGTPRKGYGSNSYWNRSGWGGGYGK